MADVFISYALRSAGGIADQICGVLAEKGISCWYAGKDMKPGDFAGSISRAIRECRIFLLILDKGAFQSAHVESEIALVFRRIVNYENVTLLPFRVENFDLSASSWAPYYLGRCQIVDGCPPDARHIQDLGKRIARLLGREKNPPEFCRASEQF